MQFLIYSLQQPCIQFPVLPRCLLVHVTLVSYFGCCVSSLALPLTHWLTYIAIASLVKPKPLHFIQIFMCLFLLCSTTAALPPSPTCLRSLGIFASGHHFIIFHFHVPLSQEGCTSRMWHFPLSLHATILPFYNSIIAKVRY